MLYPIETSAVRRAGGVALAAALLMLAPVCHAALYRWVENDGSVHYGHQPPPGVIWVEFTEDGYRSFDWETEQLDLLRRAVVDSGQHRHAAARSYFLEKAKIRASLCDLYSRYYHDAHAGLNSGKRRGAEAKYLYKSLRQYAAQKAVYC